MDANHATRAQTAPPALVRAYLERALPDRTAEPLQVRIGQEGLMWLEPGGRALRFTATQRFAVDTIAFSWRARLQLLGPFSITVVDDYAHGEGKLEARMLGVPIQRQSGPEVVQGEALRYLAELPWVPHALTRNRELEWRQLDDRRIAVAAHLHGAPLAVAIELDQAGDIARASSETRLRRVGKTWVPTPWGGDFGDYQLVGGVRIPTRAEVYWELRSGRFVYWRGHVTSLDLVDQPFRRDGREPPAPETETPGSEA